MDALILFLLKSVVVSGMLYAWYLLALKNKRLHQYNRFFLLLTLYASIQVPLLHFEWSPVYETQPEILTSAQLLLHTIDGGGAVQPATLQPTGVLVNWQMIALFITVLISLCLLIRMMIRIAWVLRISKRYPHTRAHGVTLVYTDLDKAPFSFMNSIYWRNGIPQDTESGRMIIRHELLHIKQKHSYDKLASQLLTCVFWMNPFYWIIQKELAMVHEFLADEVATINGSADPDEQTEAFARMLLQVHDCTNYFTPEHQFFSSSIKRRLTMLQKNKIVRASVLRRAAVLPLVAGSIFIFAFSPKLAPERSDKKIVLVVDAGHGGNDMGAQSGSLIEKDLNLKIAKRMKDLAPGYNIEVHLTRNGDNDMTLEQRVVFSNKLNPDDFISIHVDDKPGKANDNGTFDVAINNKNSNAEASKRLAYAVFKHASRPEWEQRNGLSEKSAYVLKENTAAAVLIEIGDIKNREQMQHIENDAKLTELCSHILQGVVEAHKK